MAHVPAVPAAVAHHGMLAIPAMVSGEVEQLGTVVVPSAGVLEGVARDAAGEPLPGARVFLMQRGGGADRAEVIADANGRFRFAPAAAGMWQGGIYHCERETLEPVGGDIEVRDGETATFELRSAR